jgi:hypothetical protein
VAAQVPEPGKARDEAQPEIGIISLNRPAQRGVQVVVVAIQPIKPGYLIGAQDMRAGLYAAVQVVGGVSAADLFAFPARFQPFVRILTQRFEQAVAFSSGGFQVSHHQRFVYQMCQEIHHVWDG